MVDFPFCIALLRPEQLLPVDIMRNRCDSVHTSVAPFAIGIISA